MSKYKPTHSSASVGQDRTMGLPQRTRIVRR
jgi:hypothetical protein